jgi:hypothetical protein
MKVNGRTGQREARMDRHDAINPHIPRQDGTHTTNEELDQQ